MSNTAKVDINKKAIEGAGKISDYLASVSIHKKVTAIIEEVMFEQLAQITDLEGVLKSVRRDMHEHDGRLTIGTQLAVDNILDMKGVPHAR
jgi:hypothetical protein